MSDLVERVARAMHEAYEDAAKEHGWKTQEDCRVEYDDLPRANKATMDASSRAAIRTVLEEAVRVLDEEENLRIEALCNRHDTDGVTSREGRMDGVVRCLYLIRALMPEKEDNA